MKKVFTIEIDTDTKQVTIKSDTTTIHPTGFILFAGDNEKCSTLHYGRYDAMVRAFYSTLADPYFQGFAEELKRSTMTEVTPDEALAKFADDVCRCEKGSCNCREKKVFH